jgi:flagellar operon protein
MVNPVQFQPLAGPRAPAAAPAANRPSAAPFAQVLRNELTADTEVRFSAHALQRLQERGISVTSTMQARLEAAVDLAASKGARDSVVLMDGTAMVVNVPNRTVITAVVTDGHDDAVFTNIDSAVVMAN